MSLFIFLFFYFGFWFFEAQAACEQALARGGECPLPL
jgi:hypothetical protein